MVRHVRRGRRNEVREKREDVFRLFFGSSLGRLSYHVLIVGLGKGCFFRQKWVVLQLNFECDEGCVVDCAINGLQVACLNFIRNSHRFHAQGLSRH